MNPRSGRKVEQDLRAMGPWVPMIAALMLPLIMGLDISLGGSDDDRRFGYGALALFALTAAGSVRWRRQPDAMAKLCITLASLYAFLVGFALATSAISFGLPVLVIMAIMLGALGAASLMFHARAARSTP